jgi:hypothetical protein
MNTTTHPKPHQPADHPAMPHQKPSTSQVEVGMRQVRADTASDEASLLGLVAEWGLTPAQFGYPWDTDDPR